MYSSIVIIHFLLSHGIISTLNKIFKKNKNKAMHVPLHTASISEDEIILEL